MKQIPQDIVTRFRESLDKKAVPKELYPHYKKWLRHYLDFNQKYQYDPSNRETLHHFIEKLRSKNQTSQQQKQAYNAISIYYEVFQASSDKRLSTPKKAEMSSGKNQKLKQTNADWKQVFDDLNNEIKTRHY